MLDIHGHETYSKVSKTRYIKLQCFRCAIPVPDTFFFISCHNIVKLNVIIPLLTKTTTKSSGTICYSQISQYDKKQTKGTSHTMTTCITSISSAMKEMMVSCSIRRFQLLQNEMKGKEKEVNVYPHAYGLGLFLKSLKV